MRGGKEVECVVVGAVYRYHSSDKHRERHPPVHFVKVRPGERMLVERLCFTFSEFNKFLFVHVVMIPQWRLPCQEKRCCAMGLSAPQTDGAKEDFLPRRSFLP